MHCIQKLHSKPFWRYFQLHLWRHFLYPTSSFSTKQFKFRFSVNGVNASYYFAVTATEYHRHLFTSKWISNAVRTPNIFLADDFNKLNFWFRRYFRPSHLGWPWVLPVWTNCSIVRFFYLHLSSNAAFWLFRGISCFFNGLYLVVFTILEYAAQHLLNLKCYPFPNSVIKSKGSSAITFFRSLRDITFSFCNSIFKAIK